MDTRGVRRGQTLFSSDGHRMGRVVRCAPEVFEVEHGFFFPRDFLVRYEEVLEVADDRVFAREPKSELLQEWRRSYLQGDRDEPRPPADQQP